MCGILAILKHEVEDKKLDLLVRSINKRGPDYHGRCDFHTKCGINITFISSILHLRGKDMQHQPMQDSSGNILLFNGQIYSYQGETLPESISDTLFLSDRLGECKTKLDVANLLSRIDGPFAVIYWSEALQTLFYGRDIFGRKSLCFLRNSTGDDIIISSVSIASVESEKLAWSEVTCIGVIALDYTNTTCKPQRTRYLWNIDQIYPKTEKCVTNRLDGDVLVNVEYLAQLNCDLRHPDEFSKEDRAVAVSELKLYLLRAIDKMLKFNQSRCLNCRSEKTSINCIHSKFAIAFSGGIDSTLLALGLDKVIDKRETIDLITVAFKENSPDRESVGCAFEEIRKLCPSRRWRLVICDVSKSELYRQREAKIRDLIWPCNTVIDDSLGCACWFIGLGFGRSIDSTMDEDEFRKLMPNFLAYSPEGCNLDGGSFQEEYYCPATMLLVGSSIDEQLGGYSSHRIAWTTRGTRGFVDEISHQMRRISTRNLGRDDRIYSDHGRDVKLPYLDLQLVSYLNQLPVGLKADFERPLDMGPKMLLRELAFEWNLHKTGRRIKRAMQFGTRIAKLENASEKGSEICHRLRQPEL